jgi:hypothetical protein
MRTGKAFEMRTGYGNYEKKEGYPYGKTAGFLNAWSKFKEKFFPHTLEFVLWSFSIYLLIMLAAYYRAGFAARLMTEFATVVLLISASQFLIPM